PAPGRVRRRPACGCPATPRRTAGAAGAPSPAPRWPLPPPLRRRETCSRPAACASVRAPAARRPPTASSGPCFLLALRSCRDFHPHLVQPVDQGRPELRLHVVQQAQPVADVL